MCVYSADDYYDLAELPEEDQVKAIVAVLYSIERDAVHIKKHPYGDHHDNSHENFERDAVIMEYVIHYYLSLLIRRNVWALLRPLYTNSVRCTINSRDTVWIPGIFRFE